MGNCNSLVLVMDCLTIVALQVHWPQRSLCFCFRRCYLCRSLPVVVSAYTLGLGFWLRSNNILELLLLLLLLLLCWLVGCFSFFLSLIFFIFGFLFLFNVLEQRTDVCFSVTLMTLATTTTTTTPPSPPPLP